MPFDEDAAHDRSEGPLAGEAGDDEPGATYRPPPHPDDRLWRHPSELRSFAPPGPIRPPPRSGRARSSTAALRAWTPRYWGLLAVATGLGALGAAAIMTTLGPQDPGEQPVSTRSTSRSSLSTDATAGAQGDAATPAPATPDPDRIDRVVVHVRGVTAGSGVVIDPAGTVLTSATVVDGDTGDTVPVTLADGRELTATVQGSDGVTDLVALTLPGDGHTAANLADRASTNRGSTVTLVTRGRDGHTHSTTGTMTSASWQFDRAGDLPPLNGLLQIWTGGDAAGPGGPVVDEDGHVVGIVTRPAGEWTYATPVELATKVGDDLLSTGSARHAWLGIEGEDAGTTVTGPGEPDEARDAAGTVTAGVRVTRTLPGDPASRHLSPGDVIVALDGIPVPDMPRLQAMLLLRRPGDRVELTYYPAGSTEISMVTVTLASR